MFVLDEADKLMDDSFEDQVNWLHAALPAHKQVLALSATYPPELLHTIRGLMRDPHMIILCGADAGNSLSLKGVRQYYCSIGTKSTNNEDSDDESVTESSTGSTSKVSSSEQDTSTFEAKHVQLLKIFALVSFNQCIVFCNRASRAEGVARVLNSGGFPSAYIAGGLDQVERNAAIQATRDFRLRVLVSTDVTSRGIDVQHVNLVVNFDKPDSIETYLHRVGRTGRFGTYGIAVTLLSASEVTNFVDEYRSTLQIEIVPLPSQIPQDLYYAPLETKEEEDCLKTLLKGKTPTAKRVSTAEATALSDDSGTTLVDSTLVDSTLFDSTLVDSTLVDSTLVDDGLLGSKSALSLVTDLKDHGGLVTDFTTTSPNLSSQPSSSQHQPHSFSYQSPITTANNSTLTPEQGPPGTLQGAHVDEPSFLDSTATPEVPSQLPSEHLSQCCFTHLSTTTPTDNINSLTTTDDHPCKTPFLGTAVSDPHHSHSPSFGDSLGRCDIPFLSSLNPAGDSTALFSSSTNDCNKRVDQASLPRRINETLVISSNQTPTHSTSSLSPRKTEDCGKRVYHASLLRRINETLVVSSPASNHHSPTHSPLPNPDVGQDHDSASMFTSLMKTKDCSKHVYPASLLRHINETSIVSSTTASNHQTPTHSPSTPSTSDSTIDGGGKQRGPDSLPSETSDDSQTLLEDQLSSESNSSHGISANGKQPPASPSNGGRRKKKKKPSLKALKPTVVTGDSSDDSDLDADEYYVPPQSIFYLMRRAKIA
mmetsp:Transcript_9929/g.16875  ORF Transcript_9929/g.16875 Transcript_9929/m.16875 type:complete len:763 (-) Transcript_9929:300-2588(-)